MESLSRTQHNLEDLIKVNVVPDHLTQYVPFSSNGYKLQSICRICLIHIEKRSKVSILSMHNNKMLIDMLKAFIPKIIYGTYPEENLPSYLCETCQYDIINCYRFKEKCEKSESILQSLLNQQNPFTEKTKDKCGKPESILQSLLKYQKPSAEKTAVNISDEAPSLRIVKSYVKDEVKEEGDLEVIKEEYLDDLDNFSSENEELSIAQNADIDVEEKQDIIETDTNSLLADVKLSDQKVSFKHICNFCFKKFEKAKNLKAHVVKKHSSSEYSHRCGQCKEVFCSQHDLEVHSAVHSSGPWWTCNKCNKTFNGRSQLRRHIQRHMDAKRFPCERCGKAFSELYALRRHARVHTGEAREKKYACHLCDKRYSEKNQLRSHLAWHLGERRCVCAACGKAFASPRLLASHRLVHSDAKPYACSYCDKRFRHESTRNTHHRTHTGEKPYVCAVCGKTFIQNSNLTMHMRTHTGERPYPCDKCDRKFATGSSLKNHQWRHSGEKPYGCNICGKRFGRQDISAHRLTHGGARAHACRACPKRFTSAARLRDHTRIHTGEKPFECASCMQKFTTKSHLVKHMKNHQKQKKRDKREVLIVEKVDYNGPVFLEDQFIVSEGEQIQNVDDQKDDKEDVMSVDNNITIELTPEVPMEVTGELVVQDDCKEILVVDNSQNDANYQSGNICINTDGVNYVNSDVNLVTVNEGTTVKLYQLDQSLVQIHSSGGQVTISKITSKMTANF